MSDRRNPCHKTHALPESLVDVIGREGVPCWVPIQTYAGAGADTCVGVDLERRLVPHPAGTVGGEILVKSFFSIAHKAAVVRCCVDDLTSIDDRVVVTEADGAGFVAFYGTRDVFCFRSEFGS